MELSDLKSVEAASVELHKIAPHIDIVILNAAVRCRCTCPGYEEPPRTEQRALMTG